MSGKLQVVKNVNISLRVNLCVTFSRTITGSGCVGTAEIKGDCERGGNGGIEETVVRDGVAIKIKHVVIKGG